MDTAAVFSTRFVPWSQTFVYDEVRSHERYRVEVFCKERLNADVFPFDAVHQPPRWAGPLYQNLAYWPSFDRLLGSGKYALIHAHFGTAAVYALPYVRKHKLPLVVTFHGNDVSALVGSQRRRVDRWRYVAASSRLFRMADLMLCDSEELRAFVTDLSGRPDAVRHAPLGIDLDRFRPLEIRPDREVPEVVLVGRFVEKKGHRYALRAFKQVIASGRRATLTFIGSGELESWCRAWVRDNGLDNAVEFAGILTPEETARRVASADIALVPSVVAPNFDREGGPLTAREASACAVPVVGTWHGGLPESIDDGVTGFLVPERNVGALADRLMTLLDDEGLRRQFGAAARRKMENEYDLNARVRILEQHYDSIR